jgi:hypothetical protein
MKNSSENNKLNSLQCHPCHAIGAQVWQQLHTGHKMSGLTPSFHFWVAILPCPKAPLQSILLEIGIVEMLEPKIQSNINQAYNPSITIFKKNLDI